MLIVIRFLIQLVLYISFIFTCPGHYLIKALADGFTLVKKCLYYYYSSKNVCMSYTIKVIRGAEA